MGGFMVLVTDETASGEALAGRLRVAGPWSVLDYRRAGRRIAEGRLVVVDLHNPIHAYYRGLQAALGAVRSAGIPVLCLVRHAGPQGWAFAKLVRADAVAQVADQTEHILAAIAALTGQASAHGGAQQAAEAAKGFFRLLFSPNGESSSAFADVGTDLVFTAVNDVGIGEWIETVQKFDDVTHQHCLLVTGLAAAFSTSLGLGERDRHLLTKGALLHDIGKTRIPAEILNKPGALTADEIAVMRSHPKLGHDMLAGGDFEREILDVVQNHHEFLDGSGYPNGLRGGEIQHLVRLITVCDVFAALIERRSYKSPLGAEEAHGILEGMEGKLDPGLVRAFRPIAAAFGTGIGTAEMPGAA